MEYDAYDDELVEIDADDQHESWDAFWAEVQREEEAERGGTATEVIRGVTVNVPYDLPLRFDRLMEKVKTSSSDEDTKMLLSDMFGVDVLDAWTDAGMTSLEFQTVLMWGFANGKGKPMTFREAYTLLKDKDSGKASTSTPKSAESGATGGRSRRTSTANTGSRLARSRL